MKKTFRKWVKFSLFLVYLVIIAGAVVRMTGSGMGCPDWPKCFGLLVPPTDITELEWHPEIEIKKGQIIIVDRSLRVARRDFKTTTTFDKNNWVHYTKHDYAEFNVAVNRLLGALGGLAVFIMGILSIRFWNSDKTLTLLALLTVFAMGFQGWLGATVVYSVLAPVKITIHMIMALIIVALLIYLLFNSKSEKKYFKYEKGLRTFSFIALLLTLIQIVLGTQVRQFVDEQIDIVGYLAKDLWLQNPILQFYFHRTFSIIVVFVNAFLAYRIYKSALGYKKIQWVIYLVAIEALTGILMYYMDFPFSTQALHLVLAAVLFGVQFYLLLEVLNAKKSHKTS